MPLFDQARREEMLEEIERGRLKLKRRAPLAEHSSISPFGSLYGIKFTEALDNAISGYLFRTSSAVRQYEKAWTEDLLGRINKAVSDALSAKDNM